MAASNPTEYARLLALKTQQATLSARIGVLERFNAQAFVAVGDAGVTTGQGTVIAAQGAAQTGGPATQERDVFVSLNTAQTPLLDQAYAALKQSAYDALAPQTRLRRYFDGIGLMIDENGFWLDYSEVDAALDAVYEVDKKQLLTDYLDLKHYAKDISADFDAHLEGLFFGWAERAVNDGTVGVFDTALSEVYASNGISVPNVVGGTVGNDSLSVNGGLLVTGRGNDTISSGSNNGVIYGGEGNDVITDSDGYDTIDGGAGDDIIVDQGYGSNLLRGGDGNDTITYSYVTSNTIEGGAGNDLIKVDYTLGGHPSCANTFSGGTGNDRIQSAGSADTFLFNRGDGQDTISDYGYYAYGAAGSDRIVFGAGIAVNDIAVSRAGANLVIRVNSPDDPAARDQLTVENWDNSRYRIEQIQFGDGTIRTAAELTTMTMTGTDAGESISLWSDATYADGRGGNDTINSGCNNAVIYGGEGNDVITDSDGYDTIDGGAGDDIIVDQGYGSNLLRGGDGNDTIIYSYITGNTIEGGAGNDLIKVDYTLGGHPSCANTFSGGTGNDRIQSAGSADTFLFNRGDGQDTISDYGYYAYGAAGSDRIVFGPDITPDQLWFRHIGNDLRVDVIGTTDSVIIENWYASSTYHIEQFKSADGKALADTQVELLVQAMASFNPPPSGQTILPQNCQEALTPLIVANWR